MLAALEDHSTDERGDVGSWIREAALEELARLFEGGKHLCEGECWQSEASTAACVAVRSALERLDKLRLPALRVLFALLSQEPSLLPDLARLRAALPPNANWAASPVVFAQLSPVLLSATYAPHVVEGIACSIGGLGRGHALEAGGSLERVLRNATAEERANAARVFCDVMARHASDARLASPLLRTLLFLVQGPLADLAEFRARLLELLRAQVKGCTDVPRLLLIVECAAALARQVSRDHTDEATRTAAKGALLFFLTHAYAKVRVAAAEALLLVSQLTDSDSVPSKSAEAMEALRSAAWAEGPVSALQPVRQRLYDLFNVPKPASPVKAETK